MRDTVCLTAIGWDITSVYQSEMKLIIEMSTRVAFASVPLMYHSNGLIVEARLLPPIKIIKHLIHELMADIVLKVNPYRNHQCTPLCGQDVQIMLGFPHGSMVMEALPPKAALLLKNFEGMVRRITYGDEQDVEVQSLVVRFLPCSKYLEIISASIYL